MAKDPAKEAKTVQELADEAAAQARAEGLKSFTKALSGWMLLHDCANPREIPDSVVESLRSGAGL